MAYIRFAAMVATSTALMFGLMYLNTYSLHHTTWSETRIYMSLIMGSAMAFVMLLFMRKIYTNRRANAAILIASAIIFSGSLWLVRTQKTIDDVDYMKAMIPHHSIAVMTSDRAQIRNPRVRRLADRILTTQLQEIQEMEGLIGELEANPPPSDALALRSPLSSPRHSISKVQAHEAAWTPAGYWAKTRELCQKERWLLTREEIPLPGARTCVLTDQHAGAWLAKCPQIGQAQVSLVDGQALDHVRFEATKGAWTIELVRCDGQDAKTDLSLFDKLHSEALAIDDLVRTGRTVRHGVITADQIFLVQAWRRNGELVKIVAPIGGGPAAGRDREFYYRAGETTPFMISDPFSTYYIDDGRIVGWFDSDGALVSTFVPAEANEREANLIAEASALREFAIPPPSRASEFMGAQPTPEA